MNLINLEDLNVLPSEEIRKRLDKTLEKKILEEENNEVGEEIETNLVNNVVPKLEEWGESSRRPISKAYICLSR